MDDMGVIAKMAGTAVHDGWKPYRGYDVVHALCNAHHLRELDGVIEHFGQEWAEQMITLLLDAKESVEQAIERGDGQLDPGVLRSIKVRYERLISKGWAANEKAATRTGKWYQDTAVNLLKRLDTHRDDVLRFTADFNVPFATTKASETSAWSSCSRRSRGHGAPSPVPITSAPSAATSRH